MNHLDLADLVALAAEVSEVEAAKLVALLDQAEVEALLAEAQASAPPHEAAAAVLVGLMALGPLPTGGRRLALLAALLLLSRNGLDVDLEPGETQVLIAGVVAGRHDAPAVAEWLSTRVTACDPLDGALRHRLGADAWQAVGGAVFRAYRHGRRQATPADLLIGIFREGTGPGALALGAADGERPQSAPHPVPNVPARLPAFEAETRRAIERGFDRRSSSATTRSRRATSSWASSTPVTATSCPTASTPAKFGGGSSSFSNQGRRTRGTLPDACAVWPAASVPWTRRRPTSSTRSPTSSASASTA